MKRSFAVLAILVFAAASALADDQGTLKRNLIREVEQDFTAAELKDLIAFYKTPVGQKTARTIPEFALGGFLRGAEMMAELGTQIEKEFENEENAAKPWKKTMADLRTVATATEAFTAGVNKYRDVRSYNDLGAILSPTYIRRMPE